MYQEKETPVMEGQGTGSSSLSRIVNTPWCCLLKIQRSILLEDLSGKLVICSSYLTIFISHWNILGKGSSICLNSPGTLMSLTMSSCPLETFTCNTGSCIPLANKCNSKIDCADESDESQCTYLEVPANYAGQLSPSSKGSSAVPVYLNISILALPRIDTILLQFTADYYVNLRW